ncbi:hypothetical protein GINT2_001472 [Glugoides intestinalis]
MSLKVLELVQLTSVAPLSMLAYSRLCPKNDLLEFFCYSIPLHLAFRFVDKVYIILLSILAILIAVPQKYHRRYDSSTNSIDNMRMLIIFLVCLAIFAADFPYYNSAKLGKSTREGFRLMDTGVGFFVYNAGIVSFKASKRKKIRNIILSAFLGIFRLISKLSLALNVKDEEFGRHLNFFLELAILNVISLGITTLRPYLMGLLILCAYQVALFLGLKNLIFNNSRENIFMANLEGIVFLIPQFGLYLISQEIGKTIIKKKVSRSTAAKGVLTTVLFCAFNFIDPANRRLHNMAYCLLIYLISTGIIIVFDYINKKFQLDTLEVSKFGSKKILFILIGANLLIPLAKYTGYFKEVSKVKIELKIQIYLFFVFYVPYKLQKVFGKQKAVINTFTEVK